MVSLLVNSLISHLRTPPPNVIDYGTGGINLQFNDKYHLQEFIMEIRKQGVKYGLELINLGKGELK